MPGMGAPGEPGGRRLSLSELAEYLLDVGATLAAYGCPTHRLEHVVRLIAELEGCSCDIHHRVQCSATADPGRVRAVPGI